jgi:hypothetical protein
MAIPVDPMVPNLDNMDLDSLAKMLAGDQQAAAQAEALRRQLTRADDMTKTNYSQIKGDPYGYQSLFGGVRDVLSNVQGTRQQQRLEPQLEDAQGRMGLGKTNFELYKQKQLEDEATRRQTVEAAKRAQEQANWKKTYEGMTSPETFANPDGSEPIQVYLTKDRGYVDANRNPVDLTGKVPYESPTSRSGRTYTPAAVNKAWFESVNRLSAGHSLLAAAAELPDTDKAVLDSNTDILGNLIISAITPDVFDQFVQSNRNLSAKTQNFLRQLNMMDAETRHKLFGAALTNSENASSKMILAQINDIGFTRALDQVVLEMEKALSIARNADYVSGLHRTDQWLKDNNIPLDAYTKRKGAPKGSAGDSEFLEKANTLVPEDKRSYFNAMSYEDQQAWLQLQEAKQQQAGGGGQ